MSNKKQPSIKIVPTNFINDYGEPKPSLINRTKNNREEAMDNTILGTLRLIEQREKGKINISDEDINEGIKANAEHLGISVEEYREKMSMITNPQPEPNPETSIETNEPRM